MNHCRQISDNSGLRGIGLDRLDTIIEWLLIALLAFMPLALGVVHAWSKQIVIIMSGAIAICFILKLMHNHQVGIIWTSAYIPIAFFLFVAVLQLIPLPVAAVNAVSPNTNAIKKQLLGDLPGATDMLKTMPLSFYSYATRHDIRLVLSVALVFVVVFNVFRRPEQIKRLLMAIAVIGGIVAMITIAQNFFGNGKIYWFVTTRYGNGYSGPFVNHSNYGQFMNLSIGAAMAYLFVQLHEVFQHREISPASVSEHFSSRQAYTFWLLAGIISLGIVTIFISLTRGGMISMLAAMVFTAISLTWRRSLKGHGWAMVAIALVAFVCILYTGFDAVYQRLATLRDFHEAQSGRLQILKDISVMWTKFPLLGTGLGTHYVVYPMFDHSTIPELAAHAENEYAQVLEETGLAGLILLVVFGFIIWLNYARTLRKTTTPINSAAYGLGFGLLAILIHSLSDFGQHLPANAFLSAIFCALILTIARHGQPVHVLPCKLKLFNLSILVLLSSVLIWSIVGANKARLGETQYTQACKLGKTLAARNWEATKSEYDDLIAYATSAVKYDPQNVEYRYWLNVYRWHSIPRETDPDTRQAIITDSALPAVRDIVEQLHQARVLCPTYGQLYSMAGQIEKLILNDDRGSDDIRKGFYLAPCDATACFMAGYLDVIEGKTDDCFAKFQRAFQLDPGLFRTVVNVYIYQLNRPALALEAAGDDSDRLNYIAGAFLDMQYYDMAQQAVGKMKDLLEARCLTQAASGSDFAMLARIYIRQQNKDAAIECLRFALAIEYSEVRWRLDLARLLAESNQIQDAIGEVKICLRLRPEFKEAKELLEKLAVNPAGFIALP